MSHSANNKTSGFFSSLRDNYQQKFSNLSISQLYTEKDGKDESDTLIHNAFVKYFDTNRQPYPEWLGVAEGVRNGEQRHSYNGSASSSGGYSAKDPHMYAQYQPVQQNNMFNNSYSQQQQQQQQQQHFQHEESPESDSRPTYQRRSSSRLQDLHNKSRQQSVPGSGYVSQPYQPARSNSYSTAGSRLREKMLNTSPGTGANTGRFANR